uniref:Reticulon domain-containing protein n=1 Tax=Araucaria cunninghamii TaxID=56994 RepID=A0A0D6QXI0_ARACU
MALEFTQKLVVKPGIPIILLLCGTLVYYHCAVLHTSVVSLACDVLVVLLCSAAVLGMMFRHLNVSVPVDPMEWQVSQETVSCIAEFMANTIGAAESVFRVAASGHDKKLFCKVVLVLYALSALGRAISGATVAYAALCLASVILFASKLWTDTTWLPPFSSRRRDNNRVGEQQS